MKSKYNMFVNIKDYRTSRIVICFLIGMLDGPNKILEWIHSYWIANPDGSLLGDGFSVKENKLVYNKLNEEITQKGNYTVRIQQTEFLMGMVRYRI
jgi:hypothetical protein